MLIYYEYLQISVLGLWITTCV